MRANRGQALLELAVFGAITLAAIGFLIRVGLRMNYDQEVRMAAFRRAMAAAGSDNGTAQDAMGTLFHYATSRQMPNPGDGYVSLPRERSEASAFVEWGDRLSYAFDDSNIVSTVFAGPADPSMGLKTQPMIVVRQDGNEKVFRQDDFPDDESLPAGTAELGIGAFHGVVTKSTMVNTVTGAAITQTDGTSALDPGSTSTTSTTWVNTKGGAVPVTGNTSNNTTNPGW